MKELKLENVGSGDGGDSKDRGLHSPDSPYSPPQEANSASNKQSARLFSLLKDGEKHIAPNFKIKEFRSKCGADLILIDTDFVKNKLQKIREYFNEAILITSAYRSKEHNKKVGGSSNSYHLKGEAFDFTIKNIPLIEIAKYAENIGIKGIIIYNNFIHLDSRIIKYFARNNNGKIY